MKAWRWAIAENIVTMSMFAIIVIFAPGEWKWTAFFCLLNLNLITRTGGE